MTFHLVMVEDTTLDVFEDTIELDELSGDAIVDAFNDALGPARLDQQYSLLAFHQSSDVTATCILKRESFTYAVALWNKGEHEDEQ
jgi:hypothetical protein